LPFSTSRFKRLAHFPEKLLAEGSGISGLSAIASGRACNSSAVTKGTLCIELSVKLIDRLPDKRSIVDFETDPEEGNFLEGLLIKVAAKMPEPDPIGWRL
jgi:hypothetical protein